MSTNEPVYDQQHYRQKPLIPGQPSHSKAAIMTTLFEKDKPAEKPNLWSYMLHMYSDYLIRY